jgi:hypothetical protein
MRGLRPTHLRGREQMMTRRCSIKAWSMLAVLVATLALALPAAHAAAGPRRAGR